MFPAITLQMNCLPPRPCSKISLQENPNQDACRVEGQTESVQHNTEGGLSCEGNRHSNPVCQAQPESKPRNNGKTERGEPGLGGGRGQGSLPGEHLSPNFFQKGVVILKTENLVVPEGENSVPYLYSAGEELGGRPFASLHSSCYFERF